MIIDEISEFTPEMVKLVTMAAKDEAGKVFIATLPTPSKITLSSLEPLAIAEDLPETISCDRPWFRWEGKLNNPLKSID